VVGIIDHWLEGEADADREPPVDQGRPSIIRDAESAAQTFRQIRANDADVLEPEPVAAMDNLAGRLAGLDGTVRTVVEATREFAAIYVRQQGTDLRLASSTSAFSRAGGFASSRHTRSRPIRSRGRPVLAPR
jgi:hypothetical protein